MCSWKRSWITITEMLLIQTIGRYFAACGCHWVTMWPAHVTKVTMARWFIFHRISHLNSHRNWIMFNLWREQISSTVGSHIIKNNNHLCMLFMNENFTTVGQQLVLCVFPGSQWSTVVAAPTWHDDDGLIIISYQPIQHMLSVYRTH